MKKKINGEKGITLIALVITIIILLILAGISISALTNQGLFKNAKIAQNATEKAEAEQGKTLNEYEDEINKYLSNNDKTEGKLVDASAIAKATDTEKATNYYGKTVTGYTPINGTTVGWKIFYADESNIYLIADDYVEPEKLPASTTASGAVTTNKPNITGKEYPKGAFFTNILNDYSTGSARVTDAKIKALNNSFFSQNLTSTNENMRAVAYMLDTKAWETFKDSANNDTSKSEYVIGGPTVEMLFKSYNQKHPGKNYEAKATNATGYQIRVNEGDWKNYADSADYLNTTDTLYVLPSSKGANAMCLASPSAYDANDVMSVRYDGRVDYYYYNRPYLGFRPLVCLKSGIKLQESGNGFEIVK